MTFKQADTLCLALANNDITLSAAVQEKFLQYLQLLEQWNRVFNLTAIREPSQMILLHILDSLAISPYLHGTRIIDVGTGAGLPGIPLALTHPDIFFLLLDSNNKKTRFLTQVMYELKLTNIEIVHKRCEDFHPELLFDSILSRALAPLPLMLQITQHLINTRGRFIAMKGTYPEQELQTIPQGFRVYIVQKLIIQGLNAERHLVCLEKEH